VTNGGSNINEGREPGEQSKVGVSGGEESETKRTIKTIKDRGCHIIKLPEVGCTS